jgi:hypothetical protein
VLPGLPDYARHGLFARAGLHEAWVRLSNGSMHLAGDRKPDIRGFAIRVLGVAGPGALGGETRAQDFALINQERFALPVDLFMGIVLAAADGNWAVLRHLTRTFGVVKGVGTLLGLLKAQARKFSGFTTEPFHSAAPIACGPYAARVRLVPTGDGRRPMPAKEWAPAVREALSRGALSWELQLQFFVDEAITPIEDATVDWPEREAPYVTVAKLQVTPQDLDGEVAKRLLAEIEQGTFDPWEALAEHRPLGQVMRARKGAYFASQKGRGAR